jgi:thiol-disulfide isomerase/thioredoxin
VKGQIGVIFAAMIILVFMVSLVAKTGSSEAAQVCDPGTATQQASADTGGPPAESHADAVAAYDDALKSDKPIYLLFHSLSCAPCIEISAVVDKVIPEYEGKVVFVNAITTDEPSKRLAERFKFQYIPQSFFIGSNGAVVDSFTGALDEPAMRAYLDKLTSR